MWTENILKAKLFQNHDIVIIMWYSCLSFSQTKIHLQCKWLVIGAFFKFLRRKVDGKQLMRFFSENTVFKFLRRLWSGPEALSTNYTLLQVYYKCIFFAFACLSEFLVMHLFVCSANREWSGSQCEQCFLHRAQATCGSAASPSRFFFRILFLRIVEAGKKDVLCIVMSNASPSSKIVLHPFS